MWYIEINEQAINKAHLYNDKRLLPLKMADVFKK
mgnify:CR=1 FL=1